MNRNDGQNPDSGLDLARTPGVRSGFRGPGKRGLDAFGSYSNTSTIFPSRARLTITKAFHGPRRGR